MDADVHEAERRPSLRVSESSGLIETSTPPDRGCNWRVISPSLEGNALAADEQYIVRRELVGKGQKSRPSHGDTNIH
jgi:hypothetical protein